ncbi:conserved hypothetical protein [Altererythrobacter sp. B11]|uniref:hypothetical protein n=1 Tax=Altererythrobacter sp. B11 TaxID=2060312 RepID=UPI000DC71CE3|nr:hypothetical protein [Altererythrobacter sp. B11]BBC71528.1 conserved hypothetical protein [Altererythrobacter sp. B11]
MLAATLILSLGSLGAAPADAEAAYRRGCHPYASKTLACSLQKQDKTAVAVAKADTVCHPDPTKSQICDARARKAAAREERLAIEDEQRSAREE